MNRQQNRMWKLLYVLFASFLIHSDGKHSGSTEPSSILHFDKALQWEQKVVGAFAFTPDGTTLVGCGGDWIDDASLPSGLRFWNVASGKSFLDLTVPNAKIISIVFSLDGNRLFSGSYDGIIRVHDLHARKTDVISDAIGQEIIMSPDGKTLAITAGQVVRLIDTSTMKVTATKDLKDALDIVPCAMAFSPNGKVIAISRQDRLRVEVYEVELCDAHSLDRISVLSDEGPAVKTLSYSADGSLLATGGDDGKVVIWELNMLKKKQSMIIFNDPNSKAINQVVFSPNGKLIGIGGSGYAAILKVDTLDEVGRIQSQGEFSFAFSPDGNRFLTSSSVSMRRHDTKLWTVNTKGLK